jgi:hypothetical protein
MITTSTNIDSIEQKATTNSIAMADISECITKVKAQNNLSNDMNILIVYKSKDIALNLSTIESDSHITSSILRIELYRTDNGQRLDTSICTDKSIEFKTPLLNQKGLNMNRYKAYKYEGIDTFNPNDPAFTDRCFSHVDKETGIETTINSRQRAYFQGLSVICNSRGGNCSYLDINLQSYISCHCTNLDPSQEVSATLVATQIQPAPNINIDLINCLSSAYVNIIYNS